MYNPKYKLMEKKTRCIKSDKFMTVDGSRFSHKQYRALLSCGENAEKRKVAAQKLVDYLCEKFEIPRCKVWVADRMPRVTRGGSNVGVYYVFHKVMTIWNNEDFMKPCSNEFFTETVLHEFMHHYDHNYLKLKKSPHSEGFYARLQDLTNKLCTR